MGLVRVDGCELFVTEVGSGPPALVMHGGLGFDQTYLTPGLDPLGRCRRLHYYDHRCNGRSGRPPLGTLTLEQLAADAEGLRLAMRAEQVTVIGHSYGGFVALEYAARYPGRVDKLVLLNTAPSGDYARGLTASAAAMGASEAILTALEHQPDDDDAAYADWIQTISPLYFAHFDPEQARRLFAGTVFCAATGAVSMERWEEWSIVDHLGQITVPTLVVVGAQDWVTPPEQSERIVNGIPGSELLVLADSSHFPWLEEPEITFEALFSFLER